MTLESGPAKTDRLYWMAVTLAALVFAAYFFYDGKWGYVQKNRAEAVKKLITLTGKSPEEIQLGDKPTQADFRNLADLGSATPEQIRSALGTPIETKRGPAGELVEYYASVYGMATITFRGGGGAAAAMDWTKWFKSKEEVRQQYYWGLIPLLFAFYTGRRAIRASTLRVLVDDEGIVYAGQRIAFDNITGLRDYNRKGWVDLYYRTDAGEKRLRLDNQKIARFEEIAQAICQAKGFENPIPPAEADDDEGAVVEPPPPPSDLADGTESEKRD